MSNSGEGPEDVDPIVEPPTDEALEQQEYRKKLEESVAEAQAHRSSGETPEEEPDAQSEPEREWKPPEEARMTAETGGLLLRLFVFAVLVFGIYFLVQQVIGLYYAPDLRSLGPVVPTERVSPGAPARVGILVRNDGEMDGAAFVVAAMQDGQEFEGDHMTVPGMDTATVWVDVPFEPGDQVFALILFDGWRDVERVTTLPGLKVEVGRHLVEMGEVSAPRSVPVGSALTVSFTLTNTGEYAERVRPVALFSSASGERPVQFQGELVEIPPGERARLEIPVDTEELDAGAVTADVIVVTESGRRIAGIASPLTMEITE